MILITYLYPRVLWIQFNPSTAPDYQLFEYNIKVNEGKSAYHHNYSHNFERQTSTGCMEANNIQSVLF